MTYKPEKTIQVVDQIRMNLIKKGLTPEMAKFFSRKWGIKKI